MKKTKYMNQAKKYETDTEREKENEKSIENVHSQECKTRIWIMVGNSCLKGQKKNTCNPIEEERKTDPKKEGE